MLLSDGVLGLALVEGLGLDLNMKTSTLQPGVVEHSCLSGAYLRRSSHFSPLSRVLHTAFLALLLIPLSTAGVSSA